ncbi:amidohydrolase family protein [Filimonas effusa]|uniref:Amidohydrolase n=1 Tax=Filimonas effusa TaxID=2508721 RepID=A0A4Q1DBN8_9BACT|nr:amidohydrolase family protein [Filimonas effusa]RXK86730.1 amidohydrolase [Filimonas effusa]
MSGKTIDTHVHIWERSLSPYNWLQAAPASLLRSYALEELEADRVAAGIHAGILVQADNTLADTEWMLKTAASAEWISGVVGWLPLAEPDKTAALLAGEYGQNGLLKGIRHLIHDEADPRWLLRENVVESLKLVAAHGLPYDLVGVLPSHIETALELAGKVPSLRMIFDHMNQPPVAAGVRFGEWGVLMREAAAHSNFFVKISGLGTAAAGGSWSADTVFPYISFVAEHFGEDRCCCGGDWPVSLPAGSYVHTWTQYREVLARLWDVAGQEKVLFTTAAGFYGV